MYILKFIFSRTEKNLCSFTVMYSFDMFIYVYVLQEKSQLNCLTPNILFDVCDFFRFISSLILTAWISATQIKLFIEYWSWICQYWTTIEYRYLILDLIFKKSSSQNTETRSTVVRPVRPVQGILLLLPNVSWDWR